MSMRGKENFEDQYNLYNRRLLINTGLWPYQDLPQRMRHVSENCVLMTIGVCLQVCCLFNLEWNIDQIAQLLQTFIPTVIFSIVYINLQYKHKTIKQIMDRVRCDWETLWNEEELIIMQTYANQGKFYSQIIKCASFFYIVLLLFPSFFSIFLYHFGKIDFEQSVLPVRSGSLVSNKLHFYILLCIEPSIVIAITYIVVSYYSLYISLIQHACALFTIIIKKIDRPLETGMYNLYWTSFVATRKQDYDWFIAVIKFYNDTIYFVDLIKAIYAKTYIMEVITALLLITLDFLYFFKMDTMEITVAEAVKNVCFIIGTMSIIYACMYIGQKLQDHCNNFYIQCRMVPFYLLSSKTQYLLLHLTMRSARSCNLSFGGIAVASHELFTELVKISFSYAMVYRNMH